MGKSIIWHSAHSLGSMLKVNSSMVGWKGEKILREREKEVRIIYPRHSVRQESLGSSIYIHSWKQGVDKQEWQDKITKQS